MLLKNGTVTLMAGDFEVSLNFYTEILGMYLQWRSENDVAYVYLQGLTLGIYQAKEKLIPSTAFQLGFTVENFDSVTEELRKKGVKNMKISHNIADSSSTHVATFKDPDGNILYISETVRVKK